MGNTLPACINEGDEIHSELSWEAVEVEQSDNDYVFAENELKLFNETNSTADTNNSIVGTTDAEIFFGPISVTLLSLPCDFQMSISDDTLSFKEERLFRGHTRRRSSLVTYSTGRTISTRGGFSMTYDDGSVEVGVTVVDSYFGNDFLSGRENSLNKGRIFDDVISVLETSAVAVRCVYKHFTLERIYSVPLAAHQLFLPEVLSDTYSRLPSDAGAMYAGKGAAEDQTFLTYCGRRYDTKYIYVFNAYGRTPLTPIGLYHPPGALDDHPGAMKLDFSVLHLPRNKFRRCAHLNSGCPESHDSCRLIGWQQPCDSDSDCLTIDLGSFRHVTHIGTAGRYPALARFPKREYTNRPRSKKRWRWQRKPDSASQEAFVHIVRPDQADALSWVTSYSVWYRSRQSRQWVFLGDFAGNTDSTSERAHCLLHHFNSPGGLLTRYLRFLPTGHVHQPVMRVAVYGNRKLEDPPDHRNGGSDTGSGSGSGKQRSGAVDDDEGGGGDSVPTKDYVVSEPLFRAHEKVRDGLHTYYKDSWDKMVAKNSKAKRRRQVQRQLQDEID